jgi:uncharacterized protein (DUF58 family)
MDKGIGLNIGGGLLQGAYCDIETLTAARFAAGELDLAPRRRAIGQLAGVSRSPLRGRGLDFEEVRAYQAGDDVRAIDWRVTARSGRPYTKIFREERERPLLLLVDQRQPMFFGSRHCFKSALAAYLGALFAWAGLARGDRVGGLVIGNDGRSDLRPHHNRRALMHWLHTLHDYNHRLHRDSRLAGGAGDSLHAALNDLRRIARPGSALFLISDFSGAEQAGALQPLQTLARHCDVTALIVGDPLERELPPPGRYTVSDGVRRLTLESGDARLRQRHREQFAARRDSLRSALNGMAIGALEIDTGQAPQRALAPLFGARR